MESLDEAESRHEEELKVLRDEIRASVKAASKSKKAETEARGIQMEFDLRARQRLEIEEIEERMMAVGLDPSNINNQASAIQQKNLEREEEENKKKEAAAQAKLQKKQKKRDKKSTKEQEELDRIESLRANAGPDLRKIELDNINAKLKVLGLATKEIMSDGNCLFRSIAAELERIKLPESQSFQALRKLAADYLRQHQEEFAPFLGFDLDSEDYENYCKDIEHPLKAVWGGEIELRALSNALNVPIIVYCADAPEVILKPSGSEIDSSEPIVRLTFHRHYFGLGEHYNAVKAT